MKGNLDNPGIRGHSWAWHHQGLVHSQLGPIKALLLVPLAVPPSWGPVALQRHLVFFLAVLCRHSPAHLWLDMLLQRSHLCKWPLTLRQQGSTTFELLAI